MTLNDQVNLWPLVPHPWRPYFAGARDELERVGRFLDEQQQVGRAWHPALKHIFRAYALTEPQSLKGILLGQDPYPGQDQPVGIAFALDPGSRLTPSARMILQEWSSDLGQPLPTHADFSQWSRRGLLLANAAATTEIGVAAGHADCGWHEVTQHVLSKIIELRQGLVFLCWGRHAQRLVLPLLEGSGAHQVICSNHPSPLSARRPPIPFVGSRPFSRFNDLRQQMGQETMDWSLS